MVKKIKGFLRENRITSSLYKKLYTLRHHKEFCEIKERRDAIQQNGIALIHFLQDVLSNEFFFFDMGTLLGIVREGRLLGHDLDVDLGVILNNKDEIEKVRSLLTEVGCEHVRSFLIDEIGIVEDSFKYNKIRFDVSYYHQREEDSVVYLTYIDPEQPLEPGLYKVVELVTSKIESVDLIEFGGKKINVPTNSEKYLSERYGMNWKIPDKGYVYWKGPSAKLTNYVGKQTIE